METTWHLNPIKIRSRISNSKIQKIGTKQQRNESLYLFHMVFIVTLRRLRKLLDVSQQKLVKLHRWFNIVWHPKSGAWILYDTIVASHIKSTWKVSFSRCLHFHYQRGVTGGYGDLFPIIWYTFINTNCIEDRFT